MEISAHPEPLEDLPTPTPAAPSSKRSALIGAVLGMTALAGTIVGVGTIAGAQDEPEPDSTVIPAAESDEADGDDESHESSLLFDAEFEAFEQCMTEQLGDLWGEPDIDVEGEIPFDEADEDKFVAAEEACNELLPEEIKAEMEAWRPYEECIDTQIGEIDDPWVDGEEPSEADWEAHDAAWQAADDACRNLLPEDVQAEMAAWDAFDDCLREAGVFDDEFSGSAVHIETGDGFQVAEFGDLEGTVTITGTDGNLTVTASGGATILDEDALDAEWKAFDEAHVACEDALPDS